MLTIDAPASLAEAGAEPLCARYARALEAAGACPIEAGTFGRLADNECGHGRLPFDSTEPCGCFPQEAPRYTNPVYRPRPAITQEEAMQLMSASEVDAALDDIAQIDDMDAREEARAALETQTPVSTLSPLVARLVADLDAEIANLTRARDALRAL